MEEKKLTRLVYMASIFIIILSLYLLRYSGFSLNNWMLVFFLIISFLIILFGKIADIIMKIFDKVASRTLIFHDYSMFLPLFFYYLVLSIFMSFLMKNSLLFSEFALTDFEIAIIALSLAFLPRVIGFTAAHERTRTMLLSILTPLTTFSLPILILKWEYVNYSPETVQYCLLGSLIFPIFGEFWIWIAQLMNILVKSPEYQRPDFLDGVRAKAWEQDFVRFTEDFKDPDLEYVRPSIINAFRAGLREALTKNSLDLKLKILYALKSMDYSIEDSLKLLDLIKELAEDENLYVRSAATESLKEVAKSKPDEVLPILKDLAKDERGSVRYDAAKSLGEVAKSKPDEVLPILTELAKDKDLWVRYDAAKSLGEVAKSKPDEVLPILTELAKYKNKHVRCAAAESLEEVAKSKPDDVLPILIELATDKYGDVQNVAAKSLKGVAKSKPDDVLPILKELANDVDWAVQKAVAELLKEVAKSKSDDVFPILIDLAKDKNKYVRAAAAKSLEEVAKSKPDDVFPILIELTKDEYVDVRAAAAKSLEEVAKSKPDDVLPILKELANDVDWAVQKAVAELLKEVAKSKSDDVFPILIELAKDEKYLFSWNSIPGDDNQRLLRYLGSYLNIVWAENAEIRKSNDSMTISISKDENSAEILMDEKKEKVTVKTNEGRTYELKVKTDNSKPCIYKEDEYVRVTATKSFREVVKTSKPDDVLPVLKEWAKDENWKVRHAATESLKEVAKSKPDDVLPILKELAKDENEYVRAAAAKSLKEVAKSKPLLPIFLKIGKK